MTLPHCPQSGHDSYHVVRDGTYSDPPVQRYRCIAPDRTFHRFVPRVAAPGSAGRCDSCGLPSPVDPASPSRTAVRGYSYSLADIANSLALVGAGFTYGETADYIHHSVRRPSTTTGTGGNLIAEWVDSFVPLIQDHRASQSWPAHVVFAAFIAPGHSKRVTNRTISCHVVVGVDDMAAASVLAIRVGHLGSVGWPDLTTQLPSLGSPRLSFETFDDQIHPLDDHFWVTQLSDEEEAPKRLKVTRPVRRPARGAPGPAERALSRGLMKFDEVRRRVLETLVNRNYSLANLERTNRAVALVALSVSGIDADEIRAVLSEHVVTTIRGTASPSVTPISR
jgi:hypothetical protein